LPQANLVGPSLCNFNYINDALIRQLSQPCGAFSYKIVSGSGNPTGVFSLQSLAKILPAQTTRLISPKFLAVGTIWPHPIARRPTSRDRVLPTPTRSTTKPYPAAAHLCSPPPHPILQGRRPRLYLCTGAVPLAGLRLARSSGWAPSPPSSNCLKPDPPPAYNIPSPRTQDQTPATSADGDAGGLY
jgi:hypothetical protein